MFMMRSEFTRVTIPGIGATFGCYRTGIRQEPIPAVGARAYLPPLASNTLLVPSRLAFLQRSASGTVCATRLANACALVYVAA